MQLCHGSNETAGCFETAGCVETAGLLLSQPIPSKPPLLWSMLLVSAVCRRLVCYCPSPSHPTTPPMVDVASVCCLPSFGLLLPQPIPSHHPPPMVDVASVCSLPSFGLLLSRVCCLPSFGLLLSQPIPSHPTPSFRYNGCYDSVVS